MPTLVIRSGNAARRRLDVSSDSTLGSASIPDDTGVLPHHAVSRPNATGGIDVSLQPGATAWLNDEPVTGDTFSLRPGDMVCFGSTWLELEHPVLASASVLLHLELDRLGHPAERGGTISPRSGRAFDTRQVAAVLLSAALWGMHEYGLVRLEPLAQEDPLLGGPFVPIGVSPAAHATERYGIEKQIIATLSAPMRLDQIVSRWFPIERFSVYANDRQRRYRRNRSHYDPWGTVVDWAVDGMEKSAMLASPPQEKPGFLGMQTESSMKSDSKIAVLRPETLATYSRFSERWAQSWLDFHQREPWFANALVTEAARVLKRAQYIDRD